MKKALPIESAGLLVFRAASNIAVAGIVRNLQAQLFSMFFSVFLFS